MPIPVAAIPILLKVLGHTSWILPLLLGATGGLSAGKDSKKYPAVTGEELTNLHTEILREFKGDEEKANRAFVERVGPKRIWAAYRNQAPPSDTAATPSLDVEKQAKHSKLRDAVAKGTRTTLGVANKGMNTLSALGAASFGYMALRDVFGGGGGMEGMPEPGMGGDPGQQAMLAAMLGGGGSASLSELETENAYLQGARSTAELRQLLSAPISSLGGNEGLDYLIQGHQDQLAQIAHREPMSMVQALAQQGLYFPSHQPQMDFRGIV